MITSTQQDPHADTSTPKPVVSYQTPAHPAPKRGKSKKDNWGSALSTIGVLLIAPIVALFLTAFVFQSYQVDGPSMETTLYNGDRLVVLKVPRTWSRITGTPYVPNRGDVVIFHESEMSSFGQDSNKQLIKRVIALPGERIVVKNNRATVYNKANPKGFQPDQTLPYGSVIENTTGDIDKVVEKNHVFVMGDNRDNSLDSRAFGTVDARNIVGKLILRVWPAGDMKAF